MKKKRYEAQALAIAMVVLVVSSIIAISVYSRVSKDKMLSLDERASAEALQISDLVLDYLTSASITKVIDSANEMATGEQNTGTIAIPTLTLTESSSANQITDLLKNKLLITDANLTDLDICPLSVSGNQYYLNIQPADSNSYFEIKAGQTFSLPINGKDFGTDACNVTMHFAVRGNNQAGFSITKVYGKSYVDGIASEYKDYSEEDVTNYCFAASGACNDSDNFQLAWVPFSDSNADTVNIALNSSDSSGNYKLDEVRIQAIGGTVGISYTTTDSANTCADFLKIVKIQAGANCSGTYRGKEILIPLKQWSSPIFNYTLLNGEGSL